MRRARSMLALALVATTPVALAGERSIVVLQDGQRIEGEVDVLEGEVEVRLSAEAGGITLRLSPSAVVRIEPLRDGPEDVLPQGVVHLNDGRELRGAVRLRPGEVSIQGAHGELVVSRDEVARIERAAPPQERLAIDADLGLALPIPEGWSADTAGGLGERLRLVRRDGAATLSVVVRLAPGRGDPQARVRAALAHDLGAQPTVEPADDGSWRVTDVHQDPVTGRRLEVVGQVELRGERAVWLRLRSDGEADAPVVERALRGRTWLADGRSRDGQVWRDAALGLLVEAPGGFRVAQQPGDARCAVTSAEGGDGRLEVHVLDGRDVRANLLDLLERPKDATLEERDGVLRATGDGERGVAFAQGERSVVVVARASSPDDLARLVRGVVAVDAAAAEAALAEDQALLGTLAAARVAGVEPVAARALVDRVLDARPEEPDALALRAALLADAGDQARLLDALDEAWVASGSPWLAERLGRALLARARALASAEPAVVGAPAPPDRSADAAAAVERAAEVWPDDEVATAAVELVTAAATRAFDAGEPLQAWARLARLRKLVGDADAVDRTERALRLRAARAALAARDPQGARREARRAWAVGADERAVDKLYADAEKLEETLEREDAAARARAPRGGGLVFGVPPSRTAGGRSTRLAQNDGNNASRRGVLARARNTSGSRRGDRVRAPQLSSGRSRFSGTRLRSNGRFVFGVPDPADDR